MERKTKSTHKKKLLVTTSTFPKWENDTVPPFIHDLSKHLTKNYEVYVLAPYSHGASLYEERDGMYIYRYKYFPGKTLITDKAKLPFLKKHPHYFVQVPFFFIKQFIEIRRLVKKHDIELIQAHWIIPQGFVAVLYKKLINSRVKIVVSSLGADIFGLRGKLFMKIKRWVMNNVCGLTATSNTIVEEARKIGFREDVPVEFITMGVDVTKCMPEKYDETLKAKYGVTGHFLLFVGRLTEKKGCNYLLEAMPAILKEFPDTKLIIIGYGEDQASLTKLARKLDLLDKSVLFIGGVPHTELPRFYATSDILVGPSVVAKGGDSDGLPVVFIEALCSGSAIITTDMPTLSDIVVDGETGFTVSQRDPGQISEKVIELLRNKELMERVGSAGREYVLKNFDWEVIADRYSAFMDRVFK